jgi:ribosomal protein L11 methyltransferase
MHVWSKLSSAKWRDAWEERFLGLGQTNAVISELPGGKSVRVEVYCEDEVTAKTIAEQFGGSVRELKMENWAAMAPPQRAPIKIRDTIVVTGEPDGEKLDQLRTEHADRHVISIPAELAFGTGEHATTSTCLRLLSDFAGEFRRAGHRWNMLDLGTGTGLLAIAAAKLGASEVEGFDFDATAVGVAQKNARRNDTPQAKLYEADIFQWQPDPNKWDVIVANIFADILEGNLDKIATALKPGGRWVISGILRESEDGVRAAAKDAGLPEPEVLRKGKWVTLRGFAG